MADFFGKIKKEVGNSAAIAGMKSKGFLEITKFRSQITTLEAQKKIHIEELGMHYYSRFTKGELQEEDSKYILDTVCNAIVDIDGQIKANENAIIQIQDAEREMQIRLKPQACTCGEPLNANAIFCKKCGTKVEDLLQKQTVQATAQLDPTVPRCSCGSQLKVDAKFCGGCGSKVEIQEANL